MAVVQFVGTGLASNAVCYLSGIRNVSLTAPETAIRDGLPFQNLDLLRRLLLRYVSTDPSLVAQVRTVSTLAYRGNFLSIFRDVYKLEDIPLDSRLCNQRKLIDIDKDLASFSAVVNASLTELRKLGLAREVVDLFETPTLSQNYSARVTGACGVVLLAAAVITA